MIARRRLLQALATLAATLLVACKHWPEGQNPKPAEPRDGGEGGY